MHSCAGFDPSLMADLTALQGIFLFHFPCICLECLHNVVDGKVVAVSSTCMSASPFHYMLLSVQICYLININIPHMELIFKQCLPAKAHHGIACSLMLDGNFVEFRWN